MLAIKSPVMWVMPSRAMLSLVPVAMAMLPEKVVQEARADASPAFWMVVVAALQLLLDWAVTQKVRIVFSSLFNQALGD